YSAEPTTCDAFARSLEGGECVDVPPGLTIADGLKPVRIGSLNWQIAGSVVAGAYRVEDTELGEAMIKLLLGVKILVEPSGAAALAVALRRALGIQSMAEQKRDRPPRIGVLLSGGNVSPELLQELLRHYGWEP
ncbi:MAG TPA: pyridoxal-phosphate dependent enzyme, partial [Nannocystis exedens]|nr:pyridoxal-phosphate dependent enzyme [Nannocystis exedens]